MNNKIWISTSGSHDSPFDELFKKYIDTDSVDYTSMYKPHTIIEDLVKKFERKDCITKSQIKEALKKAEDPVRDATDALLYAHRRYGLGIEDMYPSTMIRKEMEKEQMKNNDILWRVDSINIDSDSNSRDLIPRCDIRAELVGIPRGMYPRGSFASLRENLEDILRNGAGSKYSVKKVIFNDPATVIFWSDGTKTVVKCQKGDKYNKETGFALAYLKKVLGNDNTFNKEINKWVGEDKKK